MANNINYITTTSELKEAMQVLLNEEAVGIDLEFDKNHFRYGFNLCLVQLYTPKTGCIIIDPLEVDDLTCFYDLVNAEHVLKIAYAFGEDLRLFFELGCTPKNIYDIAIARSVCGMPNLSLSNALLQDVSVQSSNNLQRSNWCERPLSEAQLLYAAEDVIFLHDLYNFINAEVKRVGRVAWVQEEMKMLERAPLIGEVSLDQFYFKERKEMNLGEWERFKALHLVREELAKSIDRPTYKVIDRSILIDIAKSNSLKKWESYKRIHRRVFTLDTLQILQQTIYEVNRQLEDHGMDALQPARKPLPYEDKVMRSREKSRIAAIRDAVLIPIKQGLDERYGEIISTFLLSKRQMENVITGEYVLPSYRKKIFTEIAETDKIDIDKASFLK
jgi:ribonuclease D